MASAQIIDTFDTISPDWVLNRYAPAGFNSVFFDGDNRLQLTIDEADSAANRPDGANDGFDFTGAFYNTQGEMRFANITGNGDWSLSAEAYISSSFDTTTGEIIRSDLWGQTGTDPNGGDFPIIGFTNASPTDMFNAAASDRAFTFRVFDDNLGWVDLVMPTNFSFDAWHTLAITYSNNLYGFYLDGSEVYTESTTQGDDLIRGMIQGYNFGQAGSYSVDWDNVAAIPEPATTALAGGLVVLALAGYRRFKKTPQVAELS
ncbi:MAG TPA: hypothetical protein VK737_08775 [Opitutales bacterium]|nr:hypothetical protein [Opitutales bacterium]